VTPEEMHGLMMGYIDGELSPSERAAFEEALARDPTLGEELEQFKVFKQEMAQVASLEVSDHVLRRFNGSGLTRLERIVGWSTLIGGALVLAVLALREIVGGVWTRRTDRYSEERTENTPMRPRRKIEMYQIGG